MGIFDKIRGELVDIIEWTDDSKETLVHRFERYQNEIKHGAKLTVREGQQAVFINEGKVADVFRPGMYKLTTANLPLLSTLKGWAHGFNSPFKAEVYFINTRQITDQKWGTKTPIILHDHRFGILEIRSFGTYAMRVQDGAKFLKELVGTSGHFTTEDISTQLRSIIVTRFTDLVGEAELQIEAFAAKLNELSESLQSAMAIDFEHYGIELKKFLIENVSMPEEVKKEIFDFSRLQRIDMAKLTQFKSAQALEAAAKNPGGLAGAGVGMGAGFAMAHQMTGAMNFHPSSGSPSTPPPPPVPSTDLFFVLQGSEQMGPFDMAELQRWAQERRLLRSTLVWKQGMAEWDKAQNLKELNPLFQLMPPPIETSEK